VTTIQQLKLVVLAVLIGVLVYMTYDYATLGDRNDQLETDIAELREDIKTERAAREADAAAYIHRDELAAALRKERRAIDARLEQASNEDPTVRDYLREPIPAGVRDAYLGRPVPATVRD